MAGVRISEREMLAAVVPEPWLFPMRNYLCRSTGEVRKYYVDTRPRIDADPADWVEIPFYQGRGRDGGPPNFVRDFLAKNGIDAELVSDAPA